MEKPVLERLKQRIREHGESYKIVELCIDEIPFGQFTSEYVKLIEKCINVDYVTFERCDLASLENLPRFSKLESLDLGFNKITDKILDPLLKYCETLTTLNLQNNLIANVENLKVLQSLKQLTKLNLSGNQICTENYRETIFAILPQVDIIDGVTRTGENVKEESSSEGESDFSDEELDLSEEEQEKESPTKMKKKM